MRLLIVLAAIFIMIASCANRSLIGEKAVVVSKEIEPTRIMQIYSVGREEITIDEIPCAGKVYLDNQDFVIRVRTTAGDTIKYYLIPDQYESIEVGQTVLIKESFRREDFNWTHLPAAWYR